MSSSEAVEVPESANTAPVSDGDSPVSDGYSSVSPTVEHEAVQVTLPVPSSEEVVEDTGGTVEPVTVATLEEAEARIKVGVLVMNCHRVSWRCRCSPSSADPFDWA